MKNISDYLIGCCVAMVFLFITGYMHERDRLDYLARKVTYCKPPMTEGERLIVTINKTDGINCEYHQKLAYGMAPK